LVTHLVTHSAFRETNTSRQRETKTTNFLGNLTSATCRGQGETGLGHFRKPEVKGSSPFAGFHKIRN
jgi:hypothetical protein